MNGRRTSLLVFALLALAGCLSAPPGEVPASPTAETPTQTPTQAVSETPIQSPTEAPSETSEGWGDVPAPHESDADKEVRLHNDWNRSVSMAVRVVHETTNETVHEGTYDVEPGDSLTAYNLAEAETDGVEDFEVIVTARGTTERVRIRTSSCYGDAHAEIRDDGTPYVYYAVC